MRIIAFLLSLMCWQFVSAKVRLLPMFSDHMVLQQQTDAPVWGYASPRHAVRLTTSWDGRSYLTTADGDGQWRIDVRTPSAGGPYTLTITDGGKPVVLRDVMIGEVWLCAGQSNMAMPMEGWMVKTNADVIASSSQYSNIRLMHVANAVSSMPDDGMPQQKDAWQTCSPETVRKFSAAGFFFGRALSMSRNVPVGLIMSCWGGTSAESWVSPDALRTMPEFRQAVDDIQNDTLTAVQHENKYQSELTEWLKTVGQAEGSVDAAGNVSWAASGYDDGDWVVMSQPGLIDKIGYGNFDGMIWYRKVVDIPDGWDNKPLSLVLGAVDDYDVTYFNGTPIGHLENCPTIRNYTVSARLVKRGKAVVTVRVLDIGGAGGLRAKPENIYLKCGKDSIILDGEWRMKMGANLRDCQALPVNPVGNPFMPTVLYNAMIRPLIPFGIKGVIWYQGENNTPHAFRYRELLQLLINDWREQWKSPFSFLIVQLANYMKRQQQPMESEWAELRESQFKVAACMPNAGMTVSIDIGDADDIHPTDKASVGERLSLLARHVAYGEKISCYGPTLKSYLLKGNSIRVKLDHADNGLVVKGGGALKGFAVAGVDREFHWANARVDGDCVEVSSPDVAFPVAVRYAWGDNPECNLYNGVGLPAVPFRTDEWKGLTVDR